MRPSSLITSHIVFNSDVFHKYGPVTVHKAVEVGSRKSVRTSIVRDPIRCLPRSYDNETALLVSVSLACIDCPLLQRDHGSSKKETTPAWRKDTHSQSINIQHNGRSKTLFRALRFQVFCRRSSSSHSPRSGRLLLWPRQDESQSVAPCLRSGESPGS